MGTDISMYAERRKGMRWELAEPLARNPLWSAGYTELGSELKPMELYSTRNYALFAVLANVANPMRAVTPFDFISQPRGLPTDISDELRQWHSSWGRNAFFAESWLLLEELIAFDWYGKQIVRRGVVDPLAAHLFHPGRRGFPFADWPKGVTCGVANQGRGTEVKWNETYTEAVGNDFVIETIEYFAILWQFRGRSGRLLVRPLNLR